MEIAKLKYFYEVAVSGHVTKSAEKLNIAQPALSQAIKSLESELNVKLFYKNGRNVYLTESGKFLKEELDRILPQFDGIKSGIEKLQTNLKNTVKINILAASTYVINRIVKFREENPEVIIDLEQNEFRSDSDITVYTNSIESLNGKSLKRCVKEEKIYLAVPSGSKYGENDKVNLADLKNEKFVMLSGSRMFRTICDKLCACAGFTPQILFESDSPNAVQNIISTGSGIAFWPEYSWGKINNKNVKLINIETPVSQRELFFELNESSVKSKYAEKLFEMLIK